MKRGKEARMKWKVESGGRYATMKGWNASVTGWHAHWVWMVESFDHPVCAMGRLSTPCATIAEAKKQCEKWLRYFTKLWPNPTSSEPKAETPRPRKGVRARRRRGARFGSIKVTVRG